MQSKPIKIQQHFLNWSDAKIWRIQRWKSICRLYRYQINLCFIGKLITKPLLLLLKGDLFWPWTQQFFSYGWIIVFLLLLIIGMSYLLLKCGSVQSQWPLIFQECIYFFFYETSVFCFLKYPKNMEDICLAKLQECLSAKLSIHLQPLHVMPHNYMYFQSVLLGFLKKRSREIRQLKVWLKIQ